MLPEPFGYWLHTLLTLLRENDLKALFLLLLLEEAGIPLPAPGDMLIMLAGYRAFEGHVGIFEALAVVVVSVQAGSTILYLVSRRLGHHILFKFGRFIHLDQPKLHRVERWIQQRGPGMVLVGRLTPGLRTPTSIMAGVFEIPFHQFLFFTSLAALTWGVFWLALGYFFGKSLLPLTRGMHGSVLYLGIGVAALLIAAATCYRHRHRKKVTTLHSLPSTVPAQGQDRQG